MASVNRITSHYLTARAVLGLAVATLILLSTGATPRPAAAHGALSFRVAPTDDQRLSELAAPRRARDDLAARSGPVAHIRIETYTFVPQALRVKAGTTVVWTNLDANVGHTVTSDTKRWKDSPLLFQGQRFAVTFRTPGTYRYHCRPHFFDPGMHGVVLVTR